LIRPEARKIWQGLLEWKWLNVGGLTFTAVSAFGDIFFMAPDGAMLQLNTRTASSHRVADDLEGLRARLHEPAHRDQLLLERLSVLARDKGLILGIGECYAFLIGPALGGDMLARTVIKLPFVLKMQIAGGLHLELQRQRTLRKETAITD
jgi:hypothetical protein